MPGDCYCKQNVIGRTCDLCQDEFYHLTQDNALGCKGTFISEERISSCENFVVKTVRIGDLTGSSSFKAVELLLL